MRIWNSKDCILNRVYAKSRGDALFEMRISNHGPEVFSSYASRKSRREITMNALTSKSCFWGRS